MLTYRDIIVKVSGKTITDYISFIWTDRYNTCGDFEMELPFSAENNNFYRADQIVTCNLSKKKMIIETIKISISAENGKRMIVSGRSYESVLDRRVVALTQIYDNNFFNNNKFISAFDQIFRCCFGGGNREQVLTLSSPDPNTKQYKKAGFVNFRRSAGISCSVGSDPYGHISNAQINIEATGQSVLELLESHCQSKDFGFEFTGGSCLIYDGGRRNVEFSLKNGNLVSADYLESKESYKNSIYIQGDEYQANQNKIEINDVTIDTTQLEDGTAVVLTPSQTGEDPIYYRANVSVDGASGLERREMYINSSKSIGQNSNRKYVARLEAEGRVELLKNHRLKIQASCQVMHNANVIYGKDYYLGDIVTVSFDSIDDIMNTKGLRQSTKRISMRINEYTISHSDAGLELYPTLVEYDPNKLLESDRSDAGLTDEDLDDDYDQKYLKWVRVEFDFNGGHISSSSSGEVYYVPEKNYNKKLINGKYQPNTWYILPEGMESGIINTEDITGKFSYQQVGDFVTGPGVEPVKDHYIFQGWFDKDPPGRMFEDHSAGDDNTGYLIENVGEICFLANWEIEKFDITFDHGSNGHFISGGGNENGQIVYNLPYGSFPSPPGVLPEPGYHAASPLWSPEIKIVEGQATYTAQWEKDDDGDDPDLDPEDAEYDKDYNVNDDEDPIPLPSNGTTPRDRRSTAKETKESSGEDKDQFNLVHFRSRMSRSGDGYSLDNNALKLSSDGDSQGAEMYFERDIGGGIKFTAHWLDSYLPRQFPSDTPDGEVAFSYMQSTCVGIALWKNGHILGLWTWEGPGGYAFTPEVAFTTIPEYEPYYEKKTLQWGYDNGEISLGMLHLAPVFKPFKYYRYSNNKYWLLCVPPIDWLSNWGNYYYDHHAGFDVGFTCQFYDDAGNVLSPTWVRGGDENSINVNVDGTSASAETELTYGIYYTGGIWGERHEGPNTIYPPNSRRTSTGAASNREIHFNSLWTDMGWKYVRIPNERFNASGSELYTPEHFNDALYYSGNLLINESATVQKDLGGHDFWVEFAYWLTYGMAFGPGCYGYGTYVKTNNRGMRWEWDLDDRASVFGGPIIGDDEILYKIAGQSTLSAHVLEQLNNIISRSKSLCYFTYRVFLPLLAKFKYRKWYVSADGNTWYVITGAEGNSLEVKTTDKTVAQQQAEGLTGADAIVGTNGSYYKSEVYYEDINGNEFVQTSNSGQLSINDTDISGAGIEMGDYMNPDGTTYGIDIDTDTDYNKNTDGMSMKDLTAGQKADIENMFNSGSDSEMISKSTGIPKWIVDAMISSMGS